VTASRYDLVAAGRTLTALGLSPGTSGNISIREGDFMYMSPTGTELHALDPNELAVVTLAGEHLSGPRPSKEFPLHRALYRRDPTARAVVHLHSTNATAVSCLVPWSTHSAIPPITPYFLMWVGQIPLVPYAAPGDPAQATCISITASMARAVEAVIEIEEVSKIFLSIRRADYSTLSHEQALELAEKYGSPWTIRSPEVAAS
jgi:ribulose-5-phosphate 4-epimerase/fuculose-1-phosphate aldolase